MPDSLLSRSILWFDPGGTTGWCFYNGLMVPGTPHNEYHKYYHAGDFGDYDLTKVWPLLQQYKPNIVGFETYRMWASKAESRKWSDFPEIQIIGAIKLATHVALGKTPVGKTPSDRMWATDDKLRERGIYWPIIHRRDATKHILSFQKFDLTITTI